MSIRTKKFISIIILTFLSIVVSGCNTMKGIGKDFEEGGKALQELAD